MPSPGITKRILADAMKELMETRPFAKISVSHIVEACDLNRNSFYYHFKDKYDLVNWIFYTELAQDVNQIGGEASGWSMLERVLAFFYKNKSFYANALSISGQNSFAEYFVNLMNGLIRSRWEELYEEDGYQDYYISFFVDAFVATLSRWIQQGCTIPPQELAQIVKNAATGTALRVLEETREV